MRAPRILRTRIQGEEGATLAIVAIVLIALIGMIVLVVDVGGLLWKRRELVNGSDAAALAAAKTCAVTADTQPKEVVADKWAMQNVNGLQSGNGGIIADTCEAPSGFVTVEYTQPQQLFFAPVLGFGNSGDVTTRATAIWGPPGAGNPVPIVLNVGDFQGACRIPDTNAEGGELQPGDQCYFWYDNDRFDGSNFGFMNLEQWDVTSGANCSNAGANDRDGWIEGGWGGSALPLNYPDAPTYVCTDSGITAANWATLSGEEGEVKLFPINDWDGSISGWPELYGGGGQIDKFQVVGFAAMEIAGVLTVSEAGGGGDTCSDTRDFPAASPVSLVTFGNFENCFAGAPDTISAPLIRRGGTDYIEGVHYSYVPYDPAAPSTTGIITWLAPGTHNNTRVTFDWTVDGTCGQPPGNASARCLIVEWVGDSLHGTLPGGGADFGTRSIILCNPEVSGSCDPITVP